MLKEVCVADEQLTDDAEILALIISALRRLDPDARKRIYQTIGTFFQLEAVPSTAHPNLVDLKSSPSGTEVLHPMSNASSTFSGDRRPTPKQFLNEKLPRTDVDRVACLAFYLTHYRDTPEFTTLDISKLNTEAAQRKLTNATVAVNNASQYGYLVPAAKGMKQISAGGERYVQALPDYDAAKAVMASARPRWKAKRATSAKP
ncbi:MAG: hypothetical protein ABI759_11640 [Candidatus Solibacter sp.]